MKNSDRAVFAVILNQAPGVITELKKQIAEACESECKEITDISEHVQFQDIDRIAKLFNVNEIEKKMDNGFLNAIYSKLALKNIWLIKLSNNLLKQYIKQSWSPLKLKKSMRLSVAWFS